MEHCTPEASPACSYSAVAGGWADFQSREGEHGLAFGDSQETQSRCSLSQVLQMLTRGLQGISAINYWQRSSDRRVHRRLVVQEA